MKDLTPVPGHDGIFVSEDGSRVFSARRYRDGRFLSPYPNKDGRMLVNLKEGVRGVHVLVALAFHGPRPEGQVVRHLDDDLLNNHRSNLAYGTAKQNTQDSINSGRHISVKEKARTHCPSKHEYTPENTYTYKGRRSCKECGRRRVRERRKSHQALA